MSKKALTPSQIVAELDKYIVGQAATKKLVATALRERWRRQHVHRSMKEEITPGNILIVGPTGTGKTEMGRRIAKIHKVPFVKKEANEFTERGYVGDDSKTLVYDLVNDALRIVKREREEAIKDGIEEIVNRIILDIIIPPLKDESKGKKDEGSEEFYVNENTRKSFLQKIQKGELDDQEIEIQTQDRADAIGWITGNAIDENMVNQFSNFMSRFMPVKVKRRKLTILEAKKHLFEIQLEKHLDVQNLREEARKRAEEGIIFIDEIDKIISNPNRSGGGPEVSREGVQRNLLPILDGTTINTRVGPVRTQFILFIAAGSFHHNSPSELMPELQGRLPLRADMQGFSERDYCQILQEPKNSLLKQNQALLATEGIELTFTKEAVDAMAKITYRLNEETENTGARRLRTVVAHVLANVKYNTPEKIKKGTKLCIDKAFTQERLKNYVEEQGYRDYVL